MLQKTALAATISGSVSKKILVYKKYDRGVSWEEALWAELASKLPGVNLD